MQPLGLLARKAKGAQNKKTRGPFSLTLSMYPSTLPRQGKGGVLGWMKSVRECAVCCSGSVCCSVLQCVAVCCSVGWMKSVREPRGCVPLRPRARHCKTLHTATHCTLQHTAHCNILQHTAHCNTLQHTATHCNTLQHTDPVQEAARHAARTRQGARVVDREC